MTLTSVNRKLSYIGLDREVEGGRMTIATEDMIRAKSLEGESAV